jgi:hypothetical protein
MCIQIYLIRLPFAARGNMLPVFSVCVVPLFKIYLASGFAVHFSLHSVTHVGIWHAGGCS